MFGGPNADHHVWYDWKTGIHVTSSSSLFRVSLRGRENTFQLFHVAVPVVPEYLV